MSRTAGWLNGGGTGYCPTMTIRVPKELVERDPTVLAPMIDLAAVSDDEPGHGRRRRGGGFSYTDAFGAALTETEVERIQALAIPPAWADVWICPDADGYLQATGLDEAGRKQYRYHEEFRSFCDDRKFARLVYFGRAIVKIRQASTRALHEPLGSRDHAIAAAVTLIDRELLRVGNHGSASSGHYGATTLTVDHVVGDVVGDGFVALEYTAKSGKERKVIVEDDDLADVLTDLAADADDELFWFNEGPDSERRRATASDINRFIVEHAGTAFTAKDFRTWGGSRTALAARAEGDGVLDAIDAAAEELGNTRAVARSSYVHPLVADSPQARLDDVWSSSRSSKWLDRSESALIKLLTSGG